MMFPLPDIAWERGKDQKFSFDFFSMALRVTTMILNFFLLGEGWKFIDGV